MNDFCRAEPFLGEGQHVSSLNLARLSQASGHLLVVGTISNLLRFGGNGRMPMPETERRHEKYFETTIGDLRKTYGADFAKGCADDEKLPDVLRKRPSLRNVIRHQEAKRFDQI